jgi:DnaK suppressor protein
MAHHDYEPRLRKMEKELSTRTERRFAREREPADDSLADKSVAEETTSENFAEAELDATILTQVRDALQRIEDGTFGQCIVDRGPIEAKRLEASPWTPYCMKHQKLLEAAATPKTPTI